MGTYCLEHSHCKYVHHSKIEKGTTFWSLKFFRFCNPHTNYSYPYIPPFPSLNNLLFFPQDSVVEDKMTLYVAPFTHLWADHVLVTLREKSSLVVTAHSHTDKGKSTFRRYFSKSLLTVAFFWSWFWFWNYLQNCWFLHLGELSYNSLLAYP